MSLNLQILQIWLIILLHTTFFGLSSIKCTGGNARIDLQGVSPHWTPGNLAKCRTLYKHELDTCKFSNCLISLRASDFPGVECGETPCSWLRCAGYLGLGLGW